ncbi:MAG TPA: glycosyltransferase family 39 protein [Gaiellaceae bacterium]|nr:glycosyltransferase family 39 protein [Gaiellaceae bacterium]
MSRRYEWGALAALVLVSTGLRAWAALEVPVPWIAPDEMVYGLLGRALYEHGNLEILGGPTPFYSLLTPALTGFPLAAFGIDSGYDVLRGLQAFAMSLAAVPVYLWGRSLVSRRSALAAAALTVATPVLAYSGLVMSEVLFYPLLVVAAWAGAEALARPTLRNQGLAVVAVVAASATRIQAIVLLPVFATAALVDCGLARSWSNLRRLVPAAAGLGVLVVAWIAWQLGSGAGTLGGYEVIASTSYSLGAAAKFVLYHAASLLILCGLFPAAAVALLLVGAVRRGEPDPRLRAFLAVASSLSVWLVAEVGVFASRYSDRIVERNLIGLAPVLFLGLVVWLERGAPGTYVERAAVALLATVVLVLLPVDRYVNIFGTHDAMTLVPLYKLSTATSLDTLETVYPAVVGVLAIVLAFVPRRQLWVLPLVLLVAFAGASVVSSRFVADEARAQQARFLGPDPRWVDHAAQGSVAYVYDGDPDWPGVWETLFWNRRIDRVFVLGEYQIPGPLPQSLIGVEADGRVTRPGGSVDTPRYAVAATGFTFVGRSVTQIVQQGLRQAGLGLWEVEPPLRISTWTTGTQGNGDIFAGGRAQIAAFDCTRGQFRLTLLIKEPETVDLLLDGQVVKHLQFSAAGVWRGTVPVLSHTRDRPCYLQIAPSALLGSTVLLFERGVVEGAG